jgi:hypothetical protein
MVRIEPPKGTFVVFSAGSGQSALDRLSDSDPDPNSVFTRIFVPAIGSSLTLQEAIKTTQEQVVALAKSIHQDQNPAYYDEVVGSACLSVKCNAGSRIIAPDETAWQRIVTSSDPVDFESFGRLFPDSAHKAEADARAKSHRTQAETEAAALDHDPLQAPEHDYAEISSFIKDTYLPNPGRDASDFTRIYADVVDYWGKGRVTLSAIIPEKLGYFRNWPLHTYRLIDNTLAISQIGQTRRYKVSFSYEFLLSGGAKTLAGTGDAWLTIDMNCDRPLVIAENGRVTARR